jgi:hypothetical protein
MDCQVFEYVNKNKVIGVLKSGGVGEIEFEKEMEPEIIAEMRKASILFPKNVKVYEPITWSYEKKVFLSTSFEFVNL